MLINGAIAQIVARDGDLFRVQLPTIDGPLDIRLVDGRRTSPPIAYALQPRAQDDNFHFVDAVGVRAYDAPSNGNERDFRAVRLQSYQGGRMFVMNFPAGREFTVGEYVGWDWDMRRVASESWLEHSSGKRQYAWTSSAFFAGAHAGMRGTSELVDLQIRPHTVRMRPGMRGPVRLIAFFRDGPACWREDVTENASLERLDPRVLHVTAEPTLIAKQGGSTELRARYKGRLARAAVTVAALPSGSVVEWLGGYRRLHGLLPHQDGMDLIASSPEGDLYMRTPWNNELLEVQRDGGFVRSSRIATAGDGTAFMCLAWSTQLNGLLVGDTSATVWLWRRSEELVPWCRLPVNPVGLYPTEGALIIAPGGGSTVGYARLDWSKRTIAMVTPSTPTPLVGSALLPRADDVLLANFNEGRLYSIRNLDGTAEVFAEGFTNPTGLAADDEGGVYVANFGGDSISYVLP